MSCMANIKQACSGLGKVDFSKEAIPGFKKEESLCASITRVVLCAFSSYYGNCIDCSRLYLLRCWWNISILRFVYYCPVFTWCFLEYCCFKTYV